MYLDFNTSSLAYGDFTAVDSWQLFSGSSVAAGDSNGVYKAGGGIQLSAFTRYDGGATVRFIVSSASVDVAGGGPNNDVFAVVYNLQPTDQYRGDFEAGNGKPNALNNNTGSNCCPAQTIPEINIQMKSSAIVAKTRKLKAVWTPEFAQDLNAYHALDAEAELTSVLSEYISLEIDLEILSMLIEGAPNREAWSAINNQAISTNAAGTIFIANKNNNLLSLKLNLLFNLLIKNRNIKKNGINIPICFPKKIN